MKITLTVALLSTAVAFTGCQAPGRGTAGADAVTSGSGREEGSTPYAVGRSSEFQRAGLANVNMASGRAEAAMDVSGSGTGELSRRSAAATVAGTSRSAEAKRPRLEDLALEPAGAAADRIVLERVHQALGSPAPGQGAGQPLSITTLNNLRIAVTDGHVTLRGRVANAAQSQQIEALVRGVEGVGEVANELQISGPATANTAP